jgi:hypothetical protein
MFLRVLWLQLTDGHSDVTRLSTRMKIHLMRNNALVCYLSRLWVVSRADSLTNCAVSGVFGLLGCSRAFVCQTVQEALGCWRSDKCVVPKRRYTSTNIGCVAKTSSAWRQKPETSYTWWELHTSNNIFIYLATKRQQTWIALCIRYRLPLWSRMLILQM